MALLNLAVNSTDDLEIILEAVEDMGTLRGATDPYGVVAVRKKGQWYTNETTGALFISTAGDGTPEGTSWSQVIFSVVDATTDTKGIVQLCTPTELTAGVNNAKAVTPFAMAGVFEKITDHQQDINDMTSLIESIEGLTGTSAPEPNAFMQRDANGRCQVVDGVADEDIVTVGQFEDLVESAITPLSDVVDAATSESTANTICKRDVNGNIKIGTPSASTHAVPKSVTDSLSTTVGTLSSTVGTNTSDISTLQGTVSGHTTSINTNTSDISALESAVGTPTEAATANAIIKRDANGRAKIADPSAATDIASKQYADALGTDVATVSTIMRRDANGRSKVVDPSAAMDIANKQYADALGTNAATVSTIMRRDSNGRAKVASPSATDDIANKQYADALGTSAATVSTIMRRDANGRAAVAEPSASGDIATKNYVDTAVASASLVSTWSAKSSGFTAAVANGYRCSITADYNCTLPDATANAGKWIVIDIVSNSNEALYEISFVTTGGQTVGGQTSGNFKIFKAGLVIVLMSNGENWRVL